MSETESPIAAARELLAEAEASVDRARALVGTAIRLEREALGVSGRALALAMDDDPSNLSKVERGVLWAEPVVSRAWEALARLRATAGV